MSNVSPLVIMSYKCGPTFAAVTVGTIYIYVHVTSSLTKWRSEFSKERNRRDKQTVVQAAESLDNYDTVKYFNNEEHEIQEYKKIWRKYMQAQLKTMRSLALLNTSQNLIYNVGVGILMGLAVNQIKSGGMTVGDLVMVNGLLFQLNAQLNFVGSTYRDIKQSDIDIANMFNLKKLHSTIQSAPGALPLSISGETSSIKFDNVYFGYDTQPNVLNGLTFTVPSGKKAAVVGSSGSGKSTIINLLYRFYDPLQGGVYINGQSIKEVEINSLRRAIGIVPQKPKFFNKSIFYNLSYGDLTKSREEVLEAARKARVPDILMRDLDRDMGEKGEKVSLGQAQRIAIARVMLKDPHIILYDEATSSLDTVTEREIMSNLKEATVGKTTLVIAHRLSTVVDCDLILVLDKGRIVEQGTHYELLSNPHSIYTSMWNVQSQLPTNLDSLKKDTEGA
ncbi:hypothetical protein FSP39_023351 [Pinctada imbricata]|uniref:Iron-sulfur clusters transporter ABCB7, mitochondrial n=1 Tax=Pinctada imbricata TaxID=66713 RepID=A0AA89C2P1_PINIB|nr:hypothetical protein FSP39_023351 [Pinctada imbricata]